jgi:uncharacterized protein (DUF58 family)
MREPAEDGRPKIDVAVAAVRGFLDGLRLRPGGDRVALVTFNARGEILQPLGDDRAALDRALETVAVREQSRIDLGIDAGVRALGQARPERARALILLTDGLSNPVPGDEAVAAATRAKALDLSMHVIGIGTRRDEAVLRAMASDETTYHDAPSPAVWQEIYAGLAGRLRCPPEAFWGRR